MKKDNDNRKYENELGNELRVECQKPDCAAWPVLTQINGLKCLG